MGGGQDAGAGARSVPRGARKHLLCLVLGT